MSTSSLAHQRRSKCTGIFLATSFIMVIICKLERLLLANQRMKAMLSRDLDMWLRFSSAFFFFARWFRCCWNSAALARLPEKEEGAWNSWFGPWRPYFDSVLAWEIDKTILNKMPVLVFLIDTSASMNQRTHLGTSLLDIAKGAVETFMKVLEAAMHVGRSI